MKKQLKLSLMTFISIAVSAQASVYDIEGLTSTKINCANGLKGFEIKIERTGTPSTVNYNSCTDSSLVVKDSDGNSEDEGSGEESIAGGSEGSGTNTDAFWNDAYIDLTVLNTDYLNANTELMEEIPMSEWDPVTASISGEEGMNNLDTFANLETIQGGSPGGLSEFNISHNQDLTDASFPKLSALNGANMSIMYNNNLETIDLSSLSTAQMGFSEPSVSVNSNEKLHTINFSDGMSGFGELQLSSNPNLTTITGIGNAHLSSGISMHDTGYQDLSVFNGVTSESYGTFLFDDREYGTKLSADSYICQNFHQVSVQGGATPLKGNYCN